MCRDAPTVSEELQQSQVNGPFPARLLLQSDAVSRGCKHFAAADGHQLAAFILPSHVVQNSGVVDEGVQLPACKSRQYQCLCMFWPVKHKQLMLNIVADYFSNTSQNSKLEKPTKKQQLKAAAGKP